MKAKSILILLFPLLIFSCKQPSKQQFGWIEGKWVQSNGEANFHEEWTRVNDSLLIGKGFVVDGTDSLFSEKLSLLTSGEQTVYRVEMTTGRIADFKLTENTADKLVFELPENDFPSKISYTKKSETELVVLLEGNENGKEIKDELIFKRVND
ncbi:MAG: DUF6265 family protein [Bacteroidia bacterium]